MRRRIFLLFLLAALCVFPVFANGSIVYVTDTGNKYHKSGCSHLNSSQHAVKIEDAKANGYTACSICFSPGWTPGGSGNGGHSSGSRSTSPTVYTPQPSIPPTVATAPSDKRSYAKESKRTVGSESIETTVVSMAMLCALSFWLLKNAAPYDHSNSNVVRTQERNQLIQQQNKPPLPIPKPEEEYEYPPHAEPPPLYLESPEIQYPPADTYICYPDPNEWNHAKYDPYYHFVKVPGGTILITGRSNEKKYEYFFPDEEAETL